MHNYLIFYVTIPLIGMLFAICVGLNDIVAMLQKIADLLEKMEKKG